MSEVCAVAMGNLVEGGCHRGDSEDVKLGILREGGVCEGWGGCTPERLYLFLRMKKLFGEELWWRELTKKKWNGGRSLFSDKNLSSLIPILEVK